MNQQTIELTQYPTGLNSNPAVVAIIESEKEKNQKSQARNSIYQEDTSEKMFTFDSNGRLEDGRLCKFYFDQFLLFEQSCLLFSILGVVLSVFSFDSDLKGKDTLRSLLEWVLLITTLLQLIITYKRYQSKLEFMKSQILVDCQASLFFHKRLLISFIIESLILLIQPYPFLAGTYIQSIDLYDKIPFDFKLNHFLCLCLLGRIFIIFRVMLNQTQYATPRACRLGRMFGCEPGYYFIAKCLFKDDPVKSICIFLFWQIFYFAIALRIAEGPLTEIFANLNEKDNVDFSSYYNCIWCIIITMTTVGYGDFYPRTCFGRLLLICIAILGIFTISVLVVVFTNLFSLESSETSSLTLLNCLAAREGLQDKAALLLTCASRIRKEQKSNSNSFHDGYQKFDKKMETRNQIKLKDYIEGFKTMQNNLRSFYQDDSEKTQVQKLLRNMRQEIAGLTKNQNKIKNFIEIEFSTLLNENIMSQIKLKQIRMQQKVQQEQEQGQGHVQQQVQQIEREKQEGQLQGQGQEKVQEMNELKLEQKQF